MNATEPHQYEARIGSVNDMVTPAQAITLADVDAYPYHHRESLGLSELRYGAI